MKCLLLHCDNFAYETTEPTKVAFGDGKPMTRSVTNTLLVLLTIEKEDTNTDVVHATKSFIQEAEKLDTQSIVLNPFAHLSSEIANKDLAIDVLKMFQTEFDLLKPKQEVIITSFGWNKAFHMDIAGHTHAHLYRHFGNSSKHTVKHVKIDLAQSAVAPTV